MYLSPLSIEDVEYVWIFGLMIAEFLLTSGGEYLAYCETRKMLAAVRALWRMLVLCDGFCQDVNTQTETWGDEQQIGCCSHWGLLSPLV